MVGILVLGDGHFIVRGPFPDRETALVLARHWFSHTNWADDADRSAAMEH